MPHPRFRGNRQGVHIVIRASAKWLDAGVELLRELVDKQASSAFEKIAHTGPFKLIGARGRRRPITEEDGHLQRT